MCKFHVNIFLLRIILRIGSFGLQCIAITKHNQSVVMQRNVNIITSALLQSSFNVFAAGPLYT